MKDGSFEQWMVEVMSGRSRGATAGLLRATLGAIEPIYSGAASMRNRKFDRATPISLGRPTISVGNLTTGGTGKTPAVQWLVRNLIARGYRPGVLLRGYRKRPGEESDEERLLRDSLGVPVVANPDRVAGAATMLVGDANVNVFVLDDGFQHRRVARDLDIVLIDATNPFGFDHVLPRGLLREPVAGIGRAGLVVVTRTEHASEAELAAIIARVRQHNASVPIFRSTHELTHALTANDESIALSSLRDSALYAVSGIGNPAAFEKSLSDAGLIVSGAWRFADHHAYSESDVAAILHAADSCEPRPGYVMTTEKDWTKLRQLPGVKESSVPFVRTVLRMTFSGEDEAAALEKVFSHLPPNPNALSS